MGRLLFILFVFLVIYLVFTIINVVIARNGKSTTSKGDSRKSFDDEIQAVAKEIKKRKEK